MPRVARTELADGIHHVTARGNGKKLVFNDSADRHYFTRLLREVAGRFRWQCLAYCLMDNHYHLVLRTPERTLGAGMHRLNGRYAQRFNARHARCGHLWANRYYSDPLVDGAHLLEVLRYIALNPVRAGLCTMPDEWLWGAHRALAGLTEPGFVKVDEALSYFAADGGDGRARYRAFVASAT